jgi:hypothetical protein
LTASTIAAARAASSSGATSQPVRPSSTIEAGPSERTAIGGRPHAMPSTTTWPNCSRQEASATTSAPA